jgi:butyryl-CoA dehydrogenase
LLFTGGGSLDFSLNERQTALQATVRQFAEAEITPIIEKTEAQEDFPYECFKKLGRLGITGLSIPAEFGGSGDVLDMTIACEELGRHWTSIVAIVSTHINLCTWPIVRYGNDSQKKKYIPALVRGDFISAFAVTEPDSGSDILSPKTTAIRDGAYYILNGTKTFITNGDAAEVFITLAATDKSQGTRGLTAFVVEKGQPGFSVINKFNKMGMRGSPTVQLAFQNCRIPADNVLGKEGQGARVILSSLDNGRIGVASQGVGLQQAVLDACVKRAKERVQFGHPIGDNQAIAWKLADMSARLDASRLITYQAACLASQGLPFAKEAATAKLYASEAAMATATQGVQIFGGYGYMMDSPMQRYFRDAKLIEIYEGTSEMQRIILSRHLLR